jgi:hypothetical protein
MRSDVGVEFSCHRHPVADTTPASATPTERRRSGHAIGVCHAIGIRHPVSIRCAVGITIIPLSAQSQCTKHDEEHRGKHEMERAKKDVLPWHVPPATFPSTVRLHRWKMCLPACYLPWSTGSPRPCLAWAAGTADSASLPSLCLHSAMQHSVPGHSGDLPLNALPLSNVGPGCRYSLRSLRCPCAEGARLSSDTPLHPPRCP